MALLVAQGEWWRLVSAIFIHIGIIHLLFNSYALIFIGPLLEELLGKERFLAAYLATGVIGFVLSNWYYPPWLVTAGASGAVFGMIAMAVVLSRRWGSWGQVLQQQLVHWIVYAFVFGIFIGANNAAHFGGALAGAGLAFALPNPNRRQETSLEESVVAGALLGQPGDHRPVSPPGHFESVCILARRGLRPTSMEGE